MPISPEELRADFLKMEFEALEARFAFIRTDLARTETLYPLAIVAVYVWSFTELVAAPLLWQLAMCLPVPISLLAYLRVAGRMKQMLQLEAYQREIEARIYGDAEPRGWERSMGGSGPMQAYLSARLWLMGFLILATLVLAILAGEIRSQAASAMVASDSASRS